MAKTIVGLYEDRTTASRVLRELEQAGFGKDHLRFSSHESGDKTSYDVDVQEGASPSALTRYGVPQDEAEFYAEGVRRGGALIVARVRDEDAENVADVMARHNPVSYESRSQAYRSSGYTGYNASSPPYNNDQAQQERSSYAAEGQQRLQEIEENLRVGKREVVRGAVRVHKYVETENVQEQVRLREEHVDVERRNVDRALSPQEAEAAFREESFEIVERAEEPVVAKEARVVGEVEVGKETTERVETVGGEVRRTRVEVEEVPGQTVTSGTSVSSGNFSDYDNDFRSHYQSTYGSSGRDYSTYQPAYQYGYESGGRYSGRNYADVETDLRRDYEGRHGQGAFDTVKDAVRHGFERVRRAVS